MSDYYDIYQDIPRDIKAEGAVWYTRERHRLSKLARGPVRLPLAMVAGVASILSPACPWDRAVEGTKHLLAWYREGVFTLESWGALMPALPSYGHNKSKAAWLLASGDTRYISGLKVKPFWLALCGDEQSPVIDRHMIRALDGKLTKPTRATYERAMRNLILAAMRLRRPVTHVQASIWLACVKGEAP